MLEVPDAKSWSCDGWQLSDTICLVRITWYQDIEIVKYSASRRILQPNLWLWGQITCDLHAFYQSQRCGRIKFLKWLDTIKKKIQTSLPSSIDTSVSWKSSPPSEWKAGPMAIRAKRPSTHARKNRWKRLLTSWSTMQMQMRFRYQEDCRIAEIIGEYSILLRCHPWPPVNQSHGHWQLIAMECDGS